MGDRERRADALREQLLFEADGWTFPPSAWEAQIVRELHDMQGYSIPRLPPTQLLDLEMQPNDCHSNALQFQEADSTGRTKAIAGWWYQGLKFVFHSVVFREGGYWCITPSETGEEEISFYPDPLIKWIEQGGEGHAIRNGQVIGLGVRMFPAFTIAQHELVRMRLKIGMSPDQARTFSRTEVARLLDRHLTREERAMVGDL